MESRETIAAIATGMGNAGIGIVRISGDDAVAVADRVFKGKNNKKLTNSRSHMAHYGHIYDGEELIDEAREIARYAIENCVYNNIRDWSTIKSKVRDEVSHLMYEKTKRSPMILSIIMEV